VHFWADLQSVHRLHCYGHVVSELEFNVPFQHKHGYIRDDYGDITRARNVSEYVLVLALCLVDGVCLCESGVAALPSTFALPHSVTAAEDRDIVCVADRENARAQCFDLVGNLQRVIHSLQLEPTLYAITYDQYSGNDM